MLAQLALVCAACLLVVWLGYPLLIWLVAVLRGRHSVRPAEELPTVSIIIATREGEAAVRRRVENCLSLDYDATKLDVIVAVDPTSDPVSRRAIAGLASIDPRLTIVVGDEPGGKPATLNAGVRASRGEVLAFSDTHQMFDRSTVRRLVEGLGDERVGAVSGQLELPKARGRIPVIESYWRFERWLRRCEARVHSSVGVTGAVWALRRSLWKPLRDGLLLDDVYTPMRLVLDGHRVAFAERALAIETRQSTPETEYRRKVRTLTGVLQLCAWLPQLLLPFRNPVWVQFVFHKLLRLLTPYWVLGIALWATVATAGWLLEKPIVALWVLVALVALRVSGQARIFQMARTALWTGITLQVAVVSATVNGLRGRWDIWSSEGELKR